MNTENRAKKRVRRIFSLAVDLACKAVKVGCINRLFYPTSFQDKVVIPEGECTVSLFTGNFE